jgi:hypothetical protein
VELLTIYKLGAEPADTHKGLIAYFEEKKSYSGTTPYSLKASASLHMEEYT